MDRYFNKNLSLNSFDTIDCFQHEPINNLQKNFDHIVVTQPYREIKTKSLADDFYSNLLDWHNEKIYFAIEDSIFIHDFYTSKTTHFQTLPETCITSIKGMDNKILAGSSTGELHVIDLVKNKSFNYSYHKSRIGVLRTENNNILTGSRDKRIKIIDVRTYKSTNTILQHTQEVCGMDINRSYRHLVTGGNDNKIYIFDYRKLYLPIKKCTQHKAAIKALSWSPNNHNLFVSGGGTADKTVKMWDTSLINSSNGPLLKSLDYGSQICNLKWLRNNQILSTHGYSKDDIRLCGAYNFKCQKQFLSHKNRVIHFSVSPDERYFVTGSSDCSIKFWEIKNDSNNELKIR